MWTIPYLVSVLCMQGIARCKRELEAPSDSEEKTVLEEKIQRYESGIKINKEGIERYERALSSEREALQGLLPSFPSKWIIISSGN